MSLVTSEVEVGSGSLPLERLESMALEFKPKNISPSKLAKMFRQASIPVVGYINENKFFLFKSNQFYFNRLFFLGNFSLY